MQYWTGALVFELLLICLCLGAAACLRGLFDNRLRWIIPDALVAGILGFVVGPSVTAWIDFSTQGFEQIVYHGLAIVFVVVSLQTPVQDKQEQSSRGFVFAIPAIAVIQAIVGLSFVWMWNHFSSVRVHPGFGLMLPLGFNQSPGAAMTLGSTWEKSCHMIDGGQIGLIVAAIGYGWCCVAGVALIAYARLRSWIIPSEDRGFVDNKETGGGIFIENDERSVQEPVPPESGPQPTSGLKMDALTVQVVIIGGVYAATFGFILVMSSMIGQAQHRATLWGFHFLIALGIAILARKIITWSRTKRLIKVDLLDDSLLRRLTSFAVDFSTVAAISALRLEVLQQWLIPLLLMTSLCGTVTLLVCVWFGPRAFLRDRFAHVLMLFGAMTGTTPTGLALLGTIDPGLKGSVARKYVRSAAAAALFGIPLFLMMPIPVVGWPESYPDALIQLIMWLIVYLGILLFLWRLKGGLRSVRPHYKFWFQD